MLAATGIVYDGALFTLTRIFRFWSGLLVAGNSIRGVVGAPQLWKFCLVHAAPPLRVIASWRDRMLGSAAGVQYPTKTCSTGGETPFATPARGCAPCETWTWWRTTGSRLIGMCACQLGSETGPTSVGCKSSLRLFCQLPTPLTKPTLQCHRPVELSKLSK